MTLCVRCFPVQLLLLKMYSLFLFDIEIQTGQSMLLQSGAASAADIRLLFCPEGEKKSLLVHFLNVILETLCFCQNRPGIAPYESLISCLP